MGFLAGMKHIYHAVSNRKFKSLFVIFLTVLVFQNCSINSTFNVSDFSSLLTKSDSQSQMPSQTESAGGGGGDGSGFEGKLLSYYRLIPTVNCADTIDNLHTYQKINLDQNQIQSVNINTCETGNFQNLSLMTVSTLQAEVLEYNNSIYTQLNFINNNSNWFVESYCQTDQSKNLDQMNPVLLTELAVKQNYISNQTEVKLWQTQNSSQSGLNDKFTSSFLKLVRKKNPNQLIYKNDSIEINIDLLSANANISNKNKYSGTLKYNQNNQLIESPINCVLGGEFDSVIWPAKMLDVNKVIQFRKLKNNNIIYLTEFNNERRLYLKDQDQDQNQNQSINLLNNKDSDSGFEYIGHFAVTDDESHIIFTAKKTNSNIKNLYKLNLVSNQIQQLNSYIEKWEKSVSDDFEISLDSKFVIFRDGLSLFPGKPGEYTKYLKTVSIIDGKITQLHPNLGPDLEPNFFIQLSNGEIVFLVRDSVFINSQYGNSFKKLELPVDSVLVNGIIYSDEGRLIHKFVNNVETKYESTSWQAGLKNKSEFIIIPYFKGAGFGAFIYKDSKLLALPNDIFITEMLSPNLFMTVTKYNKKQIFNFSNNEVFNVDNDSLKFSYDFNLNLMLSSQMLFNSSEYNLQNGDAFNDKSIGAIYSSNAIVNNSQLKVYDEKFSEKLLLTENSRNFVTNPLGFAGGYLFWQFKFGPGIDRSGYELQFYDMQNSAKTVPNSFITGHYIEEFYLMPNQKKAIVKLSKILDSNLKYGQLPYLNKDNIKEFKTVSSLYLISLDGTGIKKISPNFDSGFNLQKVWIYSDQEIYFSAGVDPAHANQIYYWKDD